MDHAHHLDRGAELGLDQGRRPDGHVREATLDRAVDRLTLGPGAQAAVGRIDQRQVPDPAERGADHLQLPRHLAHPVVVGMQARVHGEEGGVDRLGLLERQLQPVIGPGIGAEALGAHAVEQPEIAGLGAGPQVVVEGRELRIDALAPGDELLVGHLAEPGAGHRVEVETLLVGGDHVLLVRDAGDDLELALGVVRHDDDLARRGDEALADRLGPLGPLGRGLDRRVLGREPAGDGARLVVGVVVVGAVEEHVGGVQPAVRAEVLEEPVDEGALGLGRRVERLQGLAHRLGIVVGGEHPQMRPGGRRPAGLLGDHLRVQVEPLRREEVVLEQLGGER